MSLTKRYITKIIANFISSLIGFIVLLFIPNILGPAAFGKFTYLKRIFTHLFEFLDLGTSVAFFTKISRNNRRTVLIPFYALICLIILTISIAILLLSNFIPKLNEIILDSIEIKVAALVMSYTYLLWFSTVLNKLCDAFVFTIKSEKIRIVYKTLFAISFILCVLFEYLDIVIFLQLHISTLIIYTVSLLILLRKNKILNYQILVISRSEIRSIGTEFFKFCSPLFTFNTVLTGVNLFDIWLLNKISGNIQVGIFGVALEIAGVGFILTTALSQVITREFSFRFEQSNLIEIRRLYRRYIPVIFIFGTILFTIFLFQGKNMIAIFLDNSYGESHLALITLALYYSFFSVNKILTTLFYASNNTKKYRKLGVTYLSIGLIFSVILIYFLNLGALSLALKMIITEMIAIFLLTKYIEEVIDLNNYETIYTLLKSFIGVIFLGMISELFIINKMSEVLELVTFLSVLCVLILISLKFKPEFLGLKNFNLSTLIRNIKSDKNE